MEEDKAHQLHQALQAVDAGARFKQGIGFAGRGVPARLPGGYSEDQEDDDVVARNRRIRAALYGGSLPEPEERDDGYDSDTAGAVQQRLAQLKREQQRKTGVRALDLPERLYDERRERQQVQRQQREQGERARSRSRERQRQRSRSRSRERPRGRSRSRSAGRHRRSSRSRSRTRRGERGRRHSRSSSRDRRHTGSRRGTDSRRHEERSPSREHRRRSRSCGRARGGGKHSGRPPTGGAVATGLRQLDFEALIPGYRGMTAPQKLKAKTQYLLERSAAQDQRQRDRSEREERGDGAVGGGQEAQWTRFRFDAAAELEEHRAPPSAAGASYGGEDGQEDEPAAGLLGGLNSLTFQQSNAATVQTGRDESHAAAIFGGGQPSGGPQAAPALGGPRRPAASATAKHPQTDGQAAQAAARDELSQQLALAEADGAVVVSAEELAGSQRPQQRQAEQPGAGLSWRERALAAKRAKQHG